MTKTSLEKLNERAKQRGTPFKILVVDDEQWVRDVFKDFCEVTDAFEVDLAADGTQAIQMVNDKRYDLVTLDLIMPEASGMEALTEIKRTYPQLPIVVITGNATEKLVTEAGVLGACKVMYKPLQLEHFVTEIAATLTR